MSMAMKFALACMAYATVVMLVAKQAPEQAPYIAGLAGPVLLVIVGEIMKRGWFGLGKLTAVRIAFGRDDNDEVKPWKGELPLTASCRGLNSNKTGACTPRSAYSGPSAKVMTPGWRRRMTRRRQN